jgi:hypothetical protein
MIKINLTTEKKQVDISNVAGIDLTKLKVKAIVVVIILAYLPDFTLVPIWEEGRQELGSQVAAKRGELGKIKSSISKTASLGKQIAELKALEENLSQKLMAVKSAISEKKNPGPLLLYIAKNAPPELWIKDLNIDNEVMQVKGEALDYSSIGSFVNNLKSSVFIKEANIVTTSSKVRDSDKRRVESFEIKFIIGKFEQ